jgi:hypothetical protein
VKNKSSQLTEDVDFVFTDYELTIEEVLKDNEYAHWLPNIGFTLTQPGGKVRLDGYVIEAEDALFRPLVIGERYALFLKCKLIKTALATHLVSRCHTLVNAIG